MGALQEPNPYALPLRRMLKSKVHRVSVTGAEVGYEGSLTLDAKLLEAAQLCENEQIDVVNVNNGARFSTYVIAGDEGVCCLNGGSARMGVPGDILIVMAFDLVPAPAVAAWRPTVVHVDAQNRVTSVKAERTARDASVADEVARSFVAHAPSPERCGGIGRGGSL